MTKLCWFRIDFADYLYSKIYSYCHKSKFYFQMSTFLSHSLQANSFFYKKVNDLNVAISLYHIHFSGDRDLI